MRHIWLFFSLLLVESYSAQVPSYVPLNGLQAYWPFTGNANDAYVNAYHGSVTGAQLTTDRFNLANSAYHFNGNGDYISTSCPGILNTNPRAVSFWARTPSTAEMVALFWGDNSPHNRFTCEFNYSNTGPAADIAFSAITYDSPAPVSDNEWHHYVYQFGGIFTQDIQVYQDGVLLSQQLHSYVPTATVLTTALHNVIIGRLVHPRVTRYFNGGLDDIGVWNRTLTQCEISALYSSGSQKNSEIPIDIVICSGETVTLTASGGTLYNWQPGNLSGPSITVSPQTSTIYTVSVTDASGCIKKQIQSVQVEFCTGLSHQGSSLRSLVYPNPANNYMWLDNPGTYELYNLLGEHLLTIAAHTNAFQIEIANLSAGIYIIKDIDRNVSVYLVKE